MNDRSGQDVGTIVSHNIPKIRVDPTVEKWEIDRRRWQDWGGFSETFKQFCFVALGLVVELEEVAGLVVEVDLVGVLVVGGGAGGFGGGVGGGVKGAF